MHGKNPETLLMRRQQPTIDGLARECNARAALRQHYEKQAKRLGMSLRGYCLRFNVRGVV
ncbi:hypothetical protein HOR30_gp06 [Klebsiella phage KP-Rio/2015]|uniref:Uncharacterized protein n=1 Tax=Klebsiella phage KP-Rio/2015 TaxID=1904925 RepID=A0A1D8ES02_9CAUD|nr:hypothetical protein HOR30_gp06 [Klebsiella phage KP-Rio/2015]AOT23845.1 hypothetical protein KPRIO2015_6 [Klebsiella phage KP-Rio/2015]